MPKAKITAVGCYTPPNLLTNDDLSKMVDTNDQWILERTGIRQRHIAPPEMATSDMAVEAAKIALENAGAKPEEIDCILLCTVTPDTMFPSTACLVQHRLGCTRAWGYDLIAACSGFVYGLTTAAHFIAAGHPQESSRHRRGYHVAHHRLHRSYYVRTFRRRRGRDGGGGHGR